MGGQVHMQKNGCMIEFQRLWLACGLYFTLTPLTSGVSQRFILFQRWTLLITICYSFRFRLFSSIYFHFLVLLCYHNANILRDDFLLSFKIIFFIFFYGISSLNCGSSLIIIQIWGNTRLHFFLYLIYKLNFRSIISVLKSSFCL